MGCTQSKIENEEAVARCKDRKRYMKDAVSARNAFAAAHATYAVSLRTTGGALNDFARADLQNPHAAADTSTSSVAFPTKPEIDPPPPPPPPLSDGSSALDMPPAAPLHRATSMPEYVVTKPKSKPAEAIMEEGEEDEEEIEDDANLNRRSSNRGAGGGGRMMGYEEEPPPPPETEYSRWDDYIFSTEGMTGGSLRDAEDLRKESEERERLERKVIEETAKRNEVDHSTDAATYNNVVQGGRGGGEGSRKNRKAEVFEEMVETPQKVAQKSPPLQPGGGKMSKRGKLPTKSLNFLQIFSQLDDYFLQASESASEVSKMLEAARLHYHSNFADNRGHIDHSARVMRVITWNRSFRGLPDADSGKDDFDLEENETHATVLDKLLAWEKKLYDEVKAGELMKFEYQRKVAVLNKQKKRGTNSEALEKAKADVSRLHTRYIVDMQSMDSTVAEINRLRDEQLYSKLTELVSAMAVMWMTMQDLHENQLKISLALKVVDTSQCSKETTEDLYRCTNQLLNMVEDWHLQFEKMVTNQKEYIKALNNWLKLNLVPIESSLKETVSSPPRAQNPPIQRLLRAWQEFLEKLPYEQAEGVIYSFAAVVQTILQEQEEELKLRQQCDASRKDLMTKTRKFEEWYRKHMQQAGPEEMDPDRPENSGHQGLIVEKEFVVELAKKKLEEDEEKYQRKCVHVREKTIASFRSQIPGVFQVMSEFAYSSADMYRNLNAISRSHKQKQRESTS